MQVSSLTRRITVVRLALNNTGVHYTELTAIWGCAVNDYVKKIIEVEWGQLKIGHVEPRDLSY